MARRHEAASLPGQIAAQWCYSGEYVTNTRKAETVSGRNGGRRKGSSHVLSPRCFSEPSRAENTGVLRT